MFRGNEWGISMKKKPVIFYRKDAGLWLYAVLKISCFLLLFLMFIFTYYMRLQFVL